MSTLDKLHRKKQDVARLERSLALEKIKQRKAETRRKIELGGLVIKSNMSRYSKAVVLGALIEAFEHCQKDKDYRALLEIKGKAEFLK